LINILISFRLKGWVFVLPKQIINMDKKFIALLIILAIIFLEVYYKIFSTIITGLVSIALSIAPEIGISLEFLDMPTSIVYNSYSVIRVGLHNYGSLDVNESTLRLETRTHNNLTIYIVDEQVYNLSIGERRTVTVSWYASPEPGSYKMYVYSIFDNETSNVIYSNFTILPIPVTPPRVPRIPPYEVIKILNISVIYPPRLNLTQDAEYIVLIKVINTGDLDVHNLSLKLESTGILTEVILPEMQSVLKPGSSIIFTASLKVPKELKPGNYTIDWLVYSDEINKTGKIIGEVRILDIKEKAEELLLYYTDLLDLIEEEIDAAEKEEKNVTIVRELFKDASKELEVAKELFRLTLYSSCIEHLEVVRIKIVEVVRALIYAEPIKKPILLPAFPMMPCLVWAIMLILINSIVSVFLKRKLHWAKIVLIMIGVSLLIALLAGMNCMFRVILSALVMIIIFIFYVLVERLKRERPYLLRFRRW